MYHGRELLNLWLCEAINICLLIFLDELSAKVIRANVDSLGLSPNPEIEISRY
jgi:hypothetical protein